MPLYTFLEEYDFSGKTIIPFVTHGGSSFSDTIRTIQKLQPDATVVEDGLSVSRNFTKLAVKSSSAAKLFNAVHKAQVSWKRIKPLMKQPQKQEVSVAHKIGSLEVSDLGFSYPDGSQIFQGIRFQAEPGQIIGVTGPVACGKSTFGRIFLCEYPYEGSICIDGQELQEMKQQQRVGMTGYLGHDPELFSQGQWQLLSIARAIVADPKLLLLDEITANLDAQTEKEVLVALQRSAVNRTVISIFHRVHARTGRVIHI